MPELEPQVSGSGLGPRRLLRLWERLSDSSLGGALERDRPLAPLTTYRVGGPASIWLSVGCTDDLLCAARAVSDEAAASGADPVPVLVLGRGSNLLVADRGFDGLAVSLGSGLAELRIDADPPGGGGPLRGSRVSRSGVHTITAGAAAMMPVVARACARAGLHGFEWAVGVPGTIGGAVRMNAGCHGSDMATVLVDATVVDFGTGAVNVRSVPDLHLGYRRSSVRSDEVVTSARLQLTGGASAVARDRMSEIVRWRRNNQPGGRNSGSVFANPAGDRAGRLIDSAGGKGLRIGSAEVSTKHANFIQVDHNGKARDVLAVMAEARRRVFDTSGISLRVETCLVGFTPSETAPLL